MQIGEVIGNEMCFSLGRQYGSLWVYLSLLLW
jgi:hypothetical protein